MLFILFGGVMKAASQETDWPFDDPKNVATVTVRQIIREGQPILLVSHDADDGSWQFLTGGRFFTGDAMLVALHEIVQHDPSVRELADLPLGWVATRDSAGSSWRRSPDEDTK
jgi:hypothetical protein